MGGSVLHTKVQTSFVSSHKTPSVHAVNVVTELEFNPFFWVRIEVEYILRLTKLQAEWPV
jgi:hypothetical protein